MRQKISVASSKEQISNECILDSESLVNARDGDDLSQKLMEKNNELLKLRSELEKSMSDREFDLKSISKELDVLSVKKLEFKSFEDVRSEIKSLTFQLLKSDKEKNLLKSYYDEIISRLKIDFENQRSELLKSAAGEEYYIKNQKNTSFSKNQLQQPPEKIDRDLWNTFIFADPFNSGILDAGQLQQALEHGNQIIITGPWPPTISIKTCKCLIRCVSDLKISPFITYSKFETIFSNLQTFKKSFMKFDVNRSDEYEWDLIPSTSIYPALIESGLKIKKETCDFYINHTNPTCN